MILALAVVASVAQAAPACPVSRTAEELGAALAGADAAWGNSAADFQVAVVSMRSILPCVAGAVDAPTAAHVHRIEGLVAFASRDRARTLLAFAAARAADPAWAPSDDLAPPGSPLRAAWDEASAPSTTAPLPPAREGALRVDGVPAHLRPTGRPALLQIVDERGHADTTAWLDVGAPPPAYRRAVPVAAWVGAGASVLAGGVLLGAAYGADADYRASTSVDEADRRRATVNGLAGGAVALGAVGVGLGVVAVAGTF